MQNEDYKRDSQKYEKGKIRIYKCKNKYKIGV